MTFGAGALLVRMSFKNSFGIGFVENMYIDTVAMLCCLVKISNPKDMVFKVAIAVSLSRYRALRGKIRLRVLVVGHCGEIKLDQNVVDYGVSFHVVNLFL